MNNRSTLVDVEVKLVHQTDFAYLVDNGDVKVWIPKLACELYDGVITLEEKLAIDKGLV